MKKFTDIRLWLVLIGLISVISCHKSKSSSVTTTTIAHQRVAPGDAVIYEMFVHDFSAQGTFEGAIPQLSRLKAMGINTIWLMPVYPIGVVKHLGTYGSPYSVMDYQNVNSTYGTLNDFKNLVDSAHAYGMAVMLDWVADHTSWDNAWITAHPSWYQHNGNGAIIAPPGTNWTDVAALDYTNNSMRTAMINAMAFWIVNYDIDGFRCDYADAVPDDFWTRAIDTLRPLHPLVMLAEASETRMYNDGFDMIYGWNFYNNLVSVYAGNTNVSWIATVSNSDNTVTPSGKYLLHMTTDHDFDANATPIKVFGSLAAAQSASVITLFYNPVQMIYNSQEVGSNSIINIFEKAPIVWTQNPPVQSFYNKALNLYNNQYVLHYGTTTSISAGNNVCMFTKSTQGVSALVAVNIKSTAQVVSLPAGFTNVNLTDQFSGRGVNGDTIHLAPYGYVILE